MTPTQPHPAGDSKRCPIVASIQMEPRIGQTQVNVERSIVMIEQAAAAGASVVVLPELCNTGYVFADREEAFGLAEPVPDGSTSRAWIDTARRLGIHLVAGITERDGDRLYNAALVTGPRGFIGTYRKMHLWGDENLFFEPGNVGLPVFATEIGRIGVMICYDGWFPEAYRLLAAQGADLICVPTNWVPMPNQPAHREAMANTLTIAGAYSNGLFVACANRVGTERGQPFIGQSLIAGSNGLPLAGPASLTGEEILYAPIDVARARKERQLNTFNHLLRDRRVDVYDAMLGTQWPAR